MKKLMKSFQKRFGRSRGSALLVSLMVIVGLSLLGLGFVAVSETESAIAKNQQNALQTQSVAEAGARMIVEWFQDPAWSMTYAGMPDNSSATIAAQPIPNAGAIKTTRTITGYTGLYKPKTSLKLCDKPYRPGNDDRFFGDEDHADIIINKNTGGQSMLDTFNNALLASDGNTATLTDKVAGEVTEIRIFAPPIVGGVLTNGFWAGGQRYGVATIKVTAQQFSNPAAHTGVLASHSVRLVVGELPLPIPAGPIQGDANVSFGGNFRVHWGMETSRGDLTPSLNLSSLPWANAYERPHFEHGYEQGNGISSVSITAGGTGYTSPPTVTFNGGGGAGAAGTAVLTNGVVTSVTMTSRGSGYSQQALAAPYGGCTANCLTVTFSGGGGSGAAGIPNVAAEVWPITGGTYDSVDYFHELLAKDFQDPFYGCRAYQDNTIDGSTPMDSFYQCYPYAFGADEQSVGNPSYAFQWQDANVYPVKKRVTFPVIKYDYWKRITQAGRGYKGIYYFKYDTASGGSAFKKFGQGTTHTMAYWANTINGAQLGPGVYFFDTTNGANPQTLTGASRTNALTPAESWNATDFNHGMLMSGFIYMNVNSFGTTGQGNDATTVQANFPGEPFRDIGYPRWDTANNQWDTSCGGQICKVGSGDGTFSFQDFNNNGKCDIVVMRASTWTSYDSGNAVGHTSPFTLPACGSGCGGGRDTYVIKPWKSPAQATADYGQPCVAPPATWDGTIDGTTNAFCSEPHEPYLNLVYPDQAANNNGQPYSVVVGWEPPNQQTYRPKKLDATGNPVSCSGVPSTDDCTSNSYDVDGAIVPLSVILYGILYDEGQWGSEGNAWFFGSVLVQDTINLSSGTADVWFDEKLLKGTWAPPKMPRVIVFSEQTDEQQQ